MASSSSNTGGKIQEITEDGDTSKAVDIQKLLPYIELVQKTGCLTLQEARLVKSAIDYITGKDEESKKKFLDQIEGKTALKPEQMVGNLLFGTAVRGQSKGAYTLEEAAALAELLHMD